MKQDLLNPLTDLQEVLLVFYISPNQQLWHTLAKETCTNIYFIKQTKNINKLFEKLWCWNIEDFISPIIMKIILYADGNDFHYQFTNETDMSTPNNLCGNKVQDFIDLFIDKIDGSVTQL
ncbi:hypothetical protein DXB82_00145 [Phocaeicola vulgatus]|nr:hypothetical protein DXB90_00830 [Phocaeicola vulgatus]RGN09801.1 hypothetical protein DXB82_00145 [Phocaeicola vulgatus]